MAIITCRGLQKTVVPGTTIWHALHAAQMVNAPCGGRGTCGKCRVFVEGPLSPLSSAEKKLLSPREISDGMRLACCAEIQGDVIVHVPESSHKTLRILETGAMKPFSTDPCFSGYAAAIDIGTTTLAGALCNTSGILFTASRPNPQAVYGADVISRIQKHLEGFGGELTSLVQQAVAELLTGLLEQAHLSHTALSRMAITGNTAMLYLFSGEDPACLAHAPFQATQLFGSFYNAADFHLPFPNTSVYLCRCISAFAGGDLVGSVFASGMMQHPSETAMLADIGTNGEMALFYNRQLLCCSTAAGPVFEGAEIRCGMNGSDGAIDHAWVEDGKLVTHVLGDTEPAGICGSGLIDIIAALLEIGSLSDTGALLSPDSLKGVPICRLSEHVMITQEDVRKFQLAKSAVHAGIVTLAKTAGCSLAEIAPFYVAGGFGSHIVPRAAARTGLIPIQFMQKLLCIGNGALTGAVMTVLDHGCRETCERIARNAVVVDLSVNPTFLEQYMDNMFFYI